jgi:predicted nicotinamide N-methyase
VPEIRLLVADDVVALWEAMETDGGGAGPEPPFWAAAWPGGQALARVVLDRPELVAGLGVLDLGAGSGLVAVAARLAGARTVVASEIDPYGQVVVPLNADLNGVGAIRVVGDVLAAADGWADHEALGGVDVVLAGDVCYDRVMTERVLPFLDSARAAGVRVLIGDPGRPYLPPDRLRPLAVLEVPETQGDGLRRTTVWDLP